MYEDRFGFTGRPFQLTPDPAFWYETVTHRKAMAYLGYGLAQGEGFIVVTGEIGAGKTTLMAHLLETVDPQALNAIRLVSTAIEADDLLRIVATALGADSAGLTKAQLLTAIERGLHGVARSGRRTLLLVDEAQALPVSALEELRMLSNFQLGGHALVQIVLMGQPEFRDRLNGTDRLEQLRQRVIAAHHLDPMGEDEVAAYLTHRLAIVGWTGSPGFTDDACRAFHRESEGIPRRLNQLASRALLQAGIEEIDTIDGALVCGIADDLRADLPTGASQPVSPPAVVDAEPSTPPAVVADPPAVVAPEAIPPVPLPFWLDAPDPAPEPIREATIEQLEAVQPIEPAAPDWRGEPPLFAAALVGQPFAEPEPEPEPMVVAAMPTEPLASVVAEARLAALEERVEAQDAALRRVLTLLVDWVESDAPRSSLSPLRDAAA